MSGFRIEGNTSGNVAEVDANNNMFVNLPSSSTVIGGVGAYSIMDTGAITGTQLAISPLCSEDRRLTVGVDTPLFDYTFNATAQDTGAWYYAFSTMTMTESAGSLLINANNDVTAAHGCYLMSKRYFTITGNAGLHLELTGSITNAAVANEVFITGLGIPASTTAGPTDGVWFQYTNAGLIGVLAFNGTITYTGTLVTAVTPNTVGEFKINITERIVEFWTNGILLGTIATPAGQGSPFITTSLPLFMQYYNSGTVTGTVMQVKMTDVHVDQLDSNLSKPYAHIQSAKGLMLSQGQNGGTMGTTAQFANSTNPGAAVPTNTTAALGTGLGGNFWATATLAAATDGIISSYQNPVGGTTQIPRTLYVTGVKISTYVQVACAGGPNVLNWSLAYGHTAVSLATAETGTFVTASTKAPRRIALGCQPIPTNAGFGIMPQDVVMTFNSAIVVNPGEFIATVYKPNGIAFTAGTLVHLVTFDGYWE